MAFSGIREASLCDKSKQNTLLQSFFKQKQGNQFCDVLMKVCSKEIYAHSNILAATSPYFDSFLGQDLPRQFSQRSPQIIVIQVDGNEPNELYEDAVSIVINFIYTGMMTISNGNVSQVFEISKIMQLGKVSSFCEDFLQGKVEHGTLYTLPHNIKFHSSAVNTEVATLNNGDESFSNSVWSSMEQGLNSSVIQVNKNRSRKLVSVSVQTTSVISQLPSVSSNKAKAPANNVANMLRSGKRKRLPEQNDGSLEKSLPNYIDSGLNDDIIQETVKKIKVEENLVLENGPPKIITRSGRVVIPKRWNAVEQKTESRLMKVQNKEGISSSSAAADKPKNVGSKSTQNVERKNLISWDQAMLNDNQGAYLLESNQDSQDKPGTEQHIPDMAGEFNKTINAEPVLPEISNDSDFLNQSVVETMNGNGLQKAEPITVVDKQNIDSVTDEIENVVPQVEGGSDTLTEDLKTDEVSDFEENYDPDTDQVANPDHDEVVMKKRGRPKKLIITADMIKSEPEFERSCKEYSCSECSFVTSRVREMSAHTMCHKRERGVCFFCDKPFSNKEELAKHSSTHKGLTPFECLECGLHFKTRTMLNLHLPKHSDLKPYSCEVCSMAFKWKHALKNHLVVHSNKREHLCDICGYSTAHKAQLRSHSLIHSGDTFKCDYPGCNFETIKKQNLKYHGVTHTRERPHQCEICGQNFSLLKNMKRHLKLHYTDKQHQHSCSNCGFTSTRYDKLKEHLLKQHGSGTPPERRVKVAEMTSRQEFSIDLPPDVTSEPLYTQPMVISPERTAVSKKGEAFTILTHLLEGSDTHKQVLQYGDSPAPGLDLSNKEQTASADQTHDSQLTHTSGQEVTSDHVQTVDLDHLRELDEVNSILVTEDGNQVILNAPSITLQELASVLRQNEDSTKLVQMDAPQVTSSSFALEEATTLSSQVPLHIVKEEDPKTVQYLEVLVDSANMEGVELQGINQQ